MIKRHVLSTNMELTKAISDYLNKKLDALEKFVKEEVEGIARIEVGRTTKHHNKGEIYRAEVNLQIGKMKFRAVSESNDLYKAIDEMKEEITGEVTKANKKKKHMIKKGGREIKKIIKRSKTK